MDKDLLYKIASGQIAEPKLELESDGDVQIFEGRDAKIFAFGALFGMKVSSPETSVNVKDLNA